MIDSAVLVTGAQGYAGRYLVAQLLHDLPGTRIVGVGRSPSRKHFTHGATLGTATIPAPLPDELACYADDERYCYEPADVRDAESLQKILSRHRPRAIFHLASGLRDDNPEELFSINVCGTIALLEAVAAVAIGESCKIVVSSSGSIYGAAQHLPIDESCTAEPRDYYAVSKLAAEHVSRILARERRLSVVWARIFNIIGPGADERHAAARFASQLAAIVSGACEPRMEIGDLSPTRDFIDVRDVARALAILADRGIPGTVYNVAGGVEVAMSAILEILLEEVEQKGRIELDLSYSRSSDIPRAVANTARLQTLGYKPAQTLRGSLRDMLVYYTHTVRSAVHKAVS